MIDPAAGLRAGTQTFENVASFRSGHDRVVTQVPLPLSVLLAEDVTTKRTSFGRLARGSDLEAFLHALVSLCFWHLLHHRSLLIGNPRLEGRGDTGNSRYREDVQPPRN